MQKELGGWPGTAWHRWRCSGSQVQRSPSGHRFRSRRLLRTNRKPKSKSVCGLYIDTTIMGPLLGHLDIRQKGDRGVLKKFACYAGALGKGSKSEKRGRSRRAQREPRVMEETSHDRSNRKKGERFPVASKTGRKQKAAWHGRRDDPGGGKEKVALSG